MMLSVLIFSCSDKNLDGTKEWNWDSNYLELSRSYCRVEIPHEVIRGVENARITTDVPYVFLSDSIYTGQSVFLEIEQNDEDDYREGRVFFSDMTTDEQLVVVYIKQGGKSTMTDGESYSGSLMRTYGVGYGYDATGEYASYNSVRDAVISLPALRNYERTHHSAIIVDDLKPVVEMSIIGGNSSEEVTSALGVKAGVGLDAGAFSAEVKIGYDSKDLKRSAYSFCTIYNNFSLVSRHVDPLTIAEISKEDPSVLTVGFRAAVDKIKNAIGKDLNKTSEAIDELFANYGTHFLYQSSLGGKLIFTSTFERAGLNSTMNLSASAEASFLNMCGFSATAEQKTTYEQTSTRQSRSLRVKGGDVTLCSQILHNDGESVPNSIIDAWYKSICMDINDETKNNVELIDFKLFPIYELISDDLVKNYIKQRLGLEMEYSLGRLPKAYNRGYFYYNIDSSNANSNLCPLEDEKNNEYIEVAQEYVKYNNHEYHLLTYYPILEGEVRNEGLAYDQNGDSVYQILWLNKELTLTPLCLKSEAPRVYYNDGDIGLAPSKEDSLYSALKFYDVDKYYCWDNYYGDFLRLGPFVVFKGPICQGIKNEKNYVHDVRLDLWYGISPFTTNMVKDDLSHLEKEYEIISLAENNTNHPMFSGDYYLFDKDFSDNMYLLNFTQTNDWSNVMFTTVNKKDKSEHPILLYRNTNFRY